jgi:hypothetical protein
MSWNIYTRSEIVLEAHRNEDGERSEVEVFQVVAEHVTGVRWFRDGYADQAEATAAANRVVVSPGAGANHEPPEGWYPTYPAYGSVAYGNGEEEAAWEARVEADEEAGFTDVYHAHGGWR